jgi:hypothetical protein
MITDKLIKFVKLSMWWLPQTSGTHIRESQRFKSMYTLQRKTWPTRHTHPMLSLHMVPDHTYLTWSTHSNLLWVTDRFGRIPLLLRRMAPDIIPSTHGRPIHGSIPSFSPEPTNEAVGLSQASVDDELLGLLGPYHQHAIGSFNTCSQEPTHQSLTDTGGDYILEGVGFPHTNPRPFQLTVFAFHLMVPPGLHFNQITLTKLELSF